jgi:signal transduction histidine kinase
LVIEVRDSGAGIAEADLPHIFERFYRADKSRNRDSGGAGLGLSLAKWIVEAHRGEIAVQSQDGRGSLFRVALPLERHA